MQLTSTLRTALRDAVHALDELTAVEAPDGTVRQQVRPELHMVLEEDRIAARAALARLTAALREMGEAEDLTAGGAA